MNKERIEELEERREAINNNSDECLEQYRDLLDGCVQDNCLSLKGSDIEITDPIMFNCGYSDYFDNELSEIESEIEELKEVDLK